jgi:hypothetical protein
MVLMNAGSRARHVSSLTNRSQSGGNKKAGFPYQIGRGSWSSLAINTCSPEVEGATCCTLSNMNINPVGFKLANFSRPIGSRYSINSNYWNIPTGGH